MKSSLKDSTFPLQASVALLKTPLLLAAAFFSSAALVTALWAVIARIPEKTTGIALLQPVQSVFRVDAISDGSVLYPFNTATDGTVRYGIPHWSDEALDFIRDPRDISNEDLFNLATEILSDLDRYSSIRVNLSEYSGSDVSGGSKSISVSADDVVVIIDNNARKAELFAKRQMLEDSILSYRRQLELQGVVLESNQEVLANQSGMVEAYKYLNEVGAFSKEQFYDQVSKAASAQAEVAREAEKIKEMQRQIESNQAELRTALAAFIRNSLVYPPGETSVINFLASQWTEVKQGDALMTLGWLKPVAPNTVPVFLQAKASTQVAVGMEAILTPLGFSPAEIGGIKGHITSFGTTFLSQRDISLRLGSDGYSNLVSPKGGAFEAYITLEREDHQKLIQLQSSNRGGFVWNNRATPPLPPREGILLNTQIITRYRSPLSLFIPFFKELSGLETPARLIDLQNGVRG